MEVFNLYINSTENETNSVVATSSRAPARQVPHLQEARNKRSSPPRQVRARVRMFQLLRVPAAG